MRTQHDGTAGFERDQNLIDRRRRGIGRRYDARDHPERLCNFYDLAIVEPRDHPDCFHRPDEPVDHLRRKEVFLNLVADDAVAGFIDGHPRENFGLGRGRGGARVDNCVDLVLAEFGEFWSGVFGAPCERAGFLGRDEIAIAVG
jgi:hypothetical protein